MNSKHINTVHKMLCDLRKTVDSREATRQLREKFPYLREQSFESLHRQVEHFYLYMEMIEVQHTQAKHSLLLSGSFSLFS